jgi:hypothetical protein
MEMLMQQDPSVIRCNAMITLFCLVAGLQRMSSKSRTMELQSAGVRHCLFAVSFSNYPGRTGNKFLQDLY